MRLMIGEALTLTTSHRSDRALMSAILRGVVSEIKFREVAVQVLFAAVLIDAAHPALEH